MSDSQGGAHDKSGNLTGWTLVSSQGEIMSGDDDSESSESSIEVVSLEENEVVSHRLQRGWSAEPAELLVNETLPNAESSSGDVGSNIEEVACASAAAVERVEETANLQDTSEELAVIFQALTGISATDSIKTDLTISRSSKSQNELLSRVDDGQEVNLPGDGGFIESTTESLPAFSGEIPLVSDKTDFEQASHEEDNENTPHSNTESSRGPTVVDTAGDFSVSNGDLAAKVSKMEGKDKDEVGACCLELLSESGRDVQSKSDAGDKKSSISSPVTCEEAGISPVSGEDAAGSVHGSRSDSDADSDFVRLDSDNIDAYVGEHQNNGERVVIPLRLYRTSSSIGPSFSFMRGEDQGNAIPQEVDSPDAPDQDRDEDTESSTEEAIDDRIESEQSEAGSLSAQNDVGDLSVFADIGDLPLVAGDVPRNYIHRPNNHLSTVLNIIVVLVAILTMGISLGIIMATDLEIEEWQNAHEFQTKRVNQLELMLQSKTKASELHLSKIKELESYLSEMRGTLRALEKRAKSYERAMDLLAAYSSEEGENFETSSQIILRSVKDYVRCKEESNELIMGDCRSKLFPYLKKHTSSVKDDLRLNSFDSSASLKSFETADVKMPSEGTPNPLISNIENLDSPKEEAQFQRQTSDAGPEFKFENSGMKMGNFGGDLSTEKSETSDFISESDETQDTRKVHGSGPSSEHSGHIMDKGIKAKETVRASPIPIDIRQLQQSLTREQERALHWQQLYLSERRQKERERENEEWEDEREREMEEREKEQVDQVECLKKLMSANLTTLTRHVARWNVSVFDDFANLSMLLSGIAELQQSVIDSVQRVWESAEEVIDSLQTKDKAKDGKTWENTIPKKERIAEYLSHLADRVKKADMPDHEILVGYIGRVLDHVKHSVDGILNQVYAEYVTNSVYKMWENAQEIFKDFHNNVEGMVDGRKADSALPNKGHLIEYLSKVLNDICHEVDSTTHDKESVHMDAKNEHMDEFQDPELSAHEMKKVFEYRDFNDHSFSDPDVEEDNPKRGFWSRKIGKILKKTGKTVRKIGRKVAGTWDRIKTMWHERKPFWHKIKIMWHNKKSAFFNMAEDHSSSVSQSSSRSVKTCSKFPANWFKTTETFEVDIRSRCVHKLRKQWQKMIIRDPCRVVGKFSFECNSGRKQRKRDINKIMDSFSHLLKISNFKRDQILKLDADDLKAVYKQFKSFQEKWGQSKLLLKTDMKWVDCHSIWWSAALAVSYHKNVDVLADNFCDIINLTENIHGEQHEHTFGPHTTHDEENIDYDDVIVSDDVDDDDKEDDDDHVTDDDDDDDDYKGNEEKREEVLNEAGHDKDEDDVETDYNKAEDDDEADYGIEEDDDVDDHGREEDDEDDYDKEDAEDDHSKEDKAKETNQDQKEATDKDIHGTPSFSDKSREINETTSEDILDWYSELAKHRLQLRKEKEQADWLFDQAASRQEERMRRWGDVKEDKHKKQLRGDWIFEQAKDREHQREEYGKSHWLFERASNRKENVHKKWMNEEAPHMNHRSHKKHGKKLDSWYFKQAEERRKMRENEHKSDWLFERASDRRKHHDDRHRSEFKKQDGKENGHGKQFRHSYGKVSTP